MKACNLAEPQLFAQVFADYFSYASYSLTVVNFPNNSGFLNIRSISDSEAE
jgi:hypothetical protein